MLMNDTILKCCVNVKERIHDFYKDRRGVTAIEYALIGVAMATLLAVVLGNDQGGFLGELKNTFGKIQKSIADVTSTGR